MNRESKRLSSIKTRRLALEQWLAARDSLQTISLARCRLHEGLEAMIRRHGRSPMLDVGSGLAPFSRLCAAMNLQVTRLDAQARSPGVDIIADVQNMTAVADESFATVLCAQVIEHVPDPCAALCEMTRVLRPGGILILSAPHLSLLHEVPDDYWRFTRYGLAQLLRHTSLEVVSIAPTAGIFGFLGHLLSLSWLLTAGCLPGLRGVAWKINAAILVSALGMLDRKCGAAGILPCDHVVVARKGSE
jgi:2-polyprenyl-3-methyl-5-hydroxy-6-metoxy-1,4-benzoquinol methylase